MSKTKKNKKDFYSKLAIKRFDIIKNKYNFDFTRNQLIIIAISFVVIVLFYIYLLSIFTKIPNIFFYTHLYQYDDVSDSISRCKHIRKIDGKCVKRLSYTNKYPLAVMIENHTQARPVSGIDKAQIVYEALVEGHITRFLAVFATHEEVQKIGPVRSARPYYLPYAKEFNALYAHVGGSPEALNLIPHYEILDFNEYSKGNYFWRENHTRSAPHNAYTSTELLYKGLEDYYENPDPNFDMWKFKDDADKDTRGSDNQKIQIEYSNDLYNVTWKYNKEKNIYQRYQNNEPYLTEDQNEILAKNIVVIKAKTSVIDEVGRKNIDIIGTGDAFIYRDGLSYKLTWSKKSIDEKTRFFDEDNKEFLFNSGTIWIHIIPESNKVIND